MTSKFIRSGLLVAAMLVAPFAASAADLPAPSYKAPAYVAPSYATWSGFYIGIQGGYGFGKADWAGGLLKLEPSGALAGGTIGYNLQTGTWVWGLEADIAWSGMKDEFAGIESKVNWFGTARGRIGYAGWGSMLPYITGGAAFAGVEAAGPGASEKDTRIGWTVGAGIEYAMWSSWSVKVEYLYSDLGTFECTACGVDIDHTAQVVRAGLNYRF